MYMAPEVAVTGLGSDEPLKLPNCVPLVEVPSYTVILSQQDSVPNEVNVRVMETETGLG